MRAGGEGATEDDMVEWHHQFNGHEFEPNPEIVKDSRVWQAAVHGAVRVEHDVMTEQQ